MARAGSPRCRPPPASTPPPRPRWCRRAAWPATPSGWSPARRAPRRPGGPPPSTTSRAAATAASARPIRARTAGRWASLRALRCSTAASTRPARPPRTRPRSWRPSSAASAGPPPAPAPPRRRAARPAGTVTSRCRSCEEVARMPSESQVGSTVQALGAGRHQELRDQRLVAGAAGGDQVRVGVPGAGAERLRALDLEAAVDRLVRSWSAGTAGSRRRARSSPPRTSAPSAASAEEPVAGRQRARPARPARRPAPR